MDNDQKVIKDEDGFLTSEELSALKKRPRREN